MSVFYVIFYVMCECTVIVVLYCNRKDDTPIPQIERNRPPYLSLHVLIVYFVGGVTFMEIAALRLLSKRESFPYSILICTTKVVSGKSLLQSLS